MQKYPSLFLVLLFMSAGLFAAGPNEWKKAFSSEKVKMYKGFGCEIYYFEKCTVPGKSREQLIKEYLKESDGQYGESLETRLKKANTNVAYYERQVKEAENKISELEEGSEEREEAETELKTFRSVLAKNLKLKEELEEESEKAKAEKKAAPGKKKEGGKKEKTVDTHEEITTNYYDFVSLARKPSWAHAGVNNYVQSHITIIPTLRVYLVTSPKMWNALKCETKDIWPCRNACIDKKTRSVLLFAAPALTNVLGRTLAYAAASVYYDDAIQIVNKEGELCDMIAKGILAQVSGLKDVVEVNRIYAPPSLSEKELLLPAELLNPTRMQDPKRCLAFIRQSAAMVQFLSRNARLWQYIEKAKGGNSGFRNNYEYLEVRANWAKNYDDFCNNMQERIFFPLTEKAKADPTALSEWNRNMDR